MTTMHSNTKCPYPQPEVHFCHGSCIFWSIAPDRCTFLDGLCTCNSTYESVEKYQAGYMYEHWWSYTEIEGARKNGQEIIEDWYCFTHILFILL